MYQDKQNVIFKFADLRYMMNMLHVLQDQQTKYILAQKDVMAYAVAALERSSLLSLLLLLPISFCTIKCLTNSKHY